MSSDIPKDLIPLIVSNFSRDPESFFSFIRVCKTFKQCAGDYYDIADKTCVRLFLYRLGERLNRANKGTIRITYSTNSPYFQVFHLPKNVIFFIHKETGLLSPSGHAISLPRGFIQDREPEKYFKAGAGLEAPAKLKTMLGETYIQQLEKMKEMVKSRKRKNEGENTKFYVKRVRVVLDGSN